MIKTVTMAAAFAAIGLSNVAQAVPATSDSTGQTLILVPLQLTKIADLDFGAVIPSGMSGVVTINATTGARSFAGGVVGVASDAGNRARFGGAGSPNQLVFVGIDSPTELTSPAGDTITVLALTMDGSALRTVDPDTRAFYVGVGGTLQIGADQPDGEYSAPFTVIANYM